MSHDVQANKSSMSSTFCRSGRAMTEFYIKFDVGPKTKFTSERSLANFLEIRNLDVRPS